MYSDDSVWNNIVQYYYRPEMQQDYSIDHLRMALGGTYTITSDEEEIIIGSSFPAVDAEDYIDSEDALKDFNSYKMLIEGEVIEKLEVNPVLITSINESTVVPNYKIPVRLYADNTTSKGDNFWNIYFSGGVFSDVNYPNLMNTETVFYDEFFSFSLPYSKMQTKLLDAELEITNQYQITCNYYDYNESIQHYQDWSDLRSSEKLIPNMYTSLSSHMKAADEIGELCDGPAGTRLTGLTTQDQLKIKLASNLPPTYADSIVYNVSPYALSPELGYTIPDNYLSYLAQYNQSSSIEESVIRSQENIIFDKVAMTSIEPWGVNEINSLDSWKREKLFPYEISIEFPRHKQPDAGTATITYTDDFGASTHNYVFRNIIEDRGFSSKLIESLKDTEEGLQPDVEFKSTDYIKWVHDLEPTSMPLGSTRFERKSCESIDFIELLTSMYNNQGEALNDNYMFHGLENFDQGSAYIETETYLPVTTYEDSSLYRYADSQRMLTVMDDVLDTLQSYMSIGIPREEYTTDDTDYGTYIEDSMEQAKSIMESLFIPKRKHTEVIAYKIEKEDNGQNIQNYWFFNASGAQDEITYKDTQVKYGKQYRYNVYAYVMVLAHKYRYSDFRLTKQIGTKDAMIPEADPLGFGGRFEEDTETPGVPDFYCMQFYDPTTMEGADQLFASDFEGDNTDPFFVDDIESGSRLPQYSALSQRNQWSTVQYDLSSFPQLADFHLLLEPCIKIHKIPMFSKTLGVYDNPGNAITCIPFQFLDASNKIGFNALYEDFESDLYPTIVTPEDGELMVNYLHAKDLLPVDEIVEFSQSPSRFIEIYRITKKPAQYSDFANALISTIDLKMKNSFLNYSDYIIPSEIATNKKYYYLFRFVTENGAPGHISKVLQCELIDDGGYVYSLFNVVDEEDFGEELFTQVSKTVKKIFQLEPNMAQMVLNDENVDYDQPAASQVNLMDLGASAIRDIDGSLWDKKFKIRLTSKKTGKKLDINVNFNIQTENFTMTPIESAT